VEIDRSRAGRKKDEIFLDINGVFGGIELRVPETWNVAIRLDAVFAGTDDRTSHAPSGDNVKRPTLVLTGAAVFGGITVRN
jgi:hypothetical protein